MTQKEFLIDTINHYNYNNRCTHNTGKCYYSPVSAGLEGKSKGCAIGRFMEPEVALEMDKQYENNPIMVLIRKEPNCIPDWMKSFDLRFLDAVQNLHDRLMYWNEKGLSPLGREKVLGICKDFEIEFNFEHDDN